MWLKSINDHAVINVFKWIVISQSIPMEFQWNTENQNQYHLKAFCTICSPSLLKNKDFTIFLSISESF